MGKRDLWALKLEITFLLSKLAVGRRPLHWRCERRGLNYSCYIANGLNEIFRVNSSWSSREVLQARRQTTKQTSSC